MREDTISLSHHFTYKKLLRYTLPSIVMMIFSSVYSIVDGLFVSNFAGKIPLAAINFIMPYLMILSAGGFMLGTGGNAYISKLLGEGKKEHARRIFSLIVCTTFIGGFILVIIGQIFLRPVGRLLGAQGEMLDNAVVYGRIVLCGGIPYMLQIEFQSLFNTAGKPKLGLAITVIAGVMNIVLDAVLIGGFQLGLIGAAAATTISMSFGGIVPVLCFFCDRKGDLYLVKPVWDGKALAQICWNGISEMVTNISMSLVSMLYNVRLLAVAGENGVAAYGVLMYVNMIFISAFIGYSLGTAPMIGFHFGAQNREELKSLLKKSAVILSAFAVAMVIISLALSAPLSRLFTAYDRALYEMTVHGFRIYAFSFAFAGIPIFGSSFFTALSNGKISAVISFLRTLVFQTGSVLILPLFLGLNGIWLSIVIGEALASAVAIAFILKNKERYGYL